MIYCHKYFDHLNKRTENEKSGQMVSDLRGSV